MTGNTVAQPSRSNEPLSIDNLLDSRLDETNLTTPNRVLAQYMEWHSEEAIQRAPDNRTFAIGFYSCPVQAGNRLTNFFNSLMWAIVTNRTLLWKYLDVGACRENLKADARYKKEEEEVESCAAAAAGTNDDCATKLDSCAASGAESTCAQVLQRMPWLPSYDDWKDKLSLGEPHRLHYWSTTPRAIKQAAEWYPFERGVSDLHFGVDATKMHLPLVMFPIQFAQIDFFLKARARGSLLQTEYGRDSGIGLYQEGVSFLYGMLFRYVFDMGTTPVSPGSFSVGLHSRHVNPLQDGSDIEQERLCFDTVFQHRENRSCVVYLMSDRNQTLVQVTNFLQSSNCSVVIADHTDGESFSKEHGPFAGAGFFQDMAIVSQARDAFIGSRTTSSFMVRSLIEYNRRIEAYKAGRTVEEMDFCMLR